jgi:predicted DNA-binding WGR domain protein
MSDYQTVKSVMLHFEDAATNSNKVYNMEVQVSENGQARVYTGYGRTGKSLNESFKDFETQALAEAEVEKVLKSKLKKGYVELI